MLIRFVVSNFLSFNEEREFNMLPGAFKTHKSHVYKGSRIDILKAAALYGANGAGKSNLVKALDYLQQIVNEGVVGISTDELKFKLNKDNLNKPINFEIEFSIAKKIYAYGVTVDMNIVVEEWLYESGVTSPDKLIFLRSRTKSGKTSIKMSEKHLKTPKQKYLIELMRDNLLKSNELLISKADMLRVSEITIVQRWFKHNLAIIYPESRFQELVPMLNAFEEFKTFANGLLSTFDTGVSELKLEKIDFDKFFGDEEDVLRSNILKQINDESVLSVATDMGNVIVVKENGKVVVKKVVTVHNDNNKKAVNFEINEESDGTKRLLDFIPAIDMILNSDITVVIDEIDQSIHPVLLKSLVDKIMKDETTKGQLIFTTHEANLLDLDIFRQDEIWFAEKDKKTNSTQLYSLSEFKPRFDLDIRKGYLKGRFGAIPFLANLEDLNWHEHEA